MSTIVSIHPFRRGIGKSNLTANLASSLFQRDKRIAMVDTGIQSPGSHVLFGLDQQNVGCTLNGYLYSHCSIERVAHDVTGILNQWVARGSALCLLPSSINARDIAKALREGLEASLLQNWLYELSGAFKLDFLFIAA